MEKVDRVEMILDRLIRSAEVATFPSLRKFLVALSDWWWDYLNITPRRRRGFRKCWRLA